MGRRGGDREEKLGMDVFQPQAHLLLVSDVPGGNRGSRFLGGFINFFIFNFPLQKGPSSGWT